MTTDRQPAHVQLDRAPSDQISAAVRVLEFRPLDSADHSPAMAPIDDEEISEAEEQAVARSKEWFKHNDGIPYEQVVADLGFTMGQIRSHPLEDDKEPVS